MTTPGWRKKFERTWEPYLACGKCGLQPVQDFSDQELERGRARLCRSAKERGTRFAAQSAARLYCRVTSTNCGAVAGTVAKFVKHHLALEVVGNGCKACLRKVQCQCCKTWILATRRVRQLRPLCVDALECGRCTWQVHASEASSGCLTLRRDSSITYSQAKQAKVQCVHSGRNGGVCRDAKQAMEEGLDRQ